MKPNVVKQALARGEIAVGTMVFEFTVPAIARLTAAADADFLMFDMEHTGLSTERLGMLVATAAGTGVVPLVRVPAVDFQLLSRPLEVGAMGLMIPNVETSAQAEAAVQATKYPPHGRRGTAFGIAHDDYRKGDPVETMREANEQILLIAQIESERGVSNAEEIASVDGIDVLWIGHNDLTTSMGIPAQIDHPRYLEASARVIDACQKNGLAGGFCPGSKAQAAALVEAGFRCLAYSNDIAIYREALRDGIASVRDAARAHPRSPVKAPTR